MSSTSGGIRNFENGEFKIKKLLGKGAQGLVRKAEHREYGMVAVKYFLPKHTDHGKEQDKRELEHIANQHHPHIIQFHGFLVKSSTIEGYVMEYMEDGSLHDVIHSVGIIYNLVEVANWGKQASLALDWLHSIEILHRDVKPQNMLLANGRRTLKICDLGSSRTKLLSVPMTAYVGTVPYMAPELLTANETEKYSKKCDVYSLGISLWEMSTRKVPYEEYKDKNDFALGTFIASGGRVNTTLIKDDDLREITEPCLSSKEAKRSTMNIIKNKLSFLYYKTVTFSKGKVREFEIGEFSKMEAIGMGVFGILSRAQHQTLGTVAVTRFLNLLDYEYIQREVDHLDMIHRHKNIIRFHGIVVDKINENPKITGFIMEYMDGGSLHELIHNPQFEYKLVDIARWGSEASHALALLHSKGIIHRDVKTHNMMLTNGTKTLKIGGFAYATRQESAMSMSNGTLSDMAPELISAEYTGQYDNKCDVYSLGISLWEMSTRQIPNPQFANTNTVDIIKYVIEGERPELAFVKNDILKKTIKRCLLADATDRPTMLQIHSLLINLHTMENVQLRKDKVRFLKTGTIQHVSHMEFSPDNDIIVTICKDENMVQLWDVKTTEHNMDHGEGLISELPLEPVNYEKPKPNVVCLSWSRRGNMFAAGSDGGSLRIWSTGGKWKSVVCLHRGSMNCLAWNRFNDYILTGGGDGRSFVWDPYNERQIQECYFHRSSVTVVAWISADSFASSSLDMPVFICRVGCKIPLRTMGTENFTSLIFDQNSNLFATINSSKLQVWSLTEYTRLWDKTFDFIMEVAWSNQRNVLAIFSMGGIQLWNVHKQELLLTIEMSNYGCCFAFSPDGHYLATGGDERRRVSVWDLQTGFLVHCYVARGLAGTIRRIVWNSRGDRIVAADEWGIITLLDVDPLKCAKIPSSSFRSCTLM